MSQKHRFGWIPSIPSPRDYKLQLSRSWWKPLPEFVDLRMSMPLVWDQGEIGRCTSTATLAAWYYEEYVQRVAGLMPTDFIPFVDPSFSYQYYNTRSLDDTTDYDSGASIRDALKAMNKFGVVKEKYCSNAINLTAKPPESAYTASIDAGKLCYARIQPTAKAVMMALAEGRCPILGLTLFESYDDPEGVQKTGYLPIPKRGEKELGGHCVIVTGYDQKVRRFYIRNSYGASWGLFGYFTVDFDYIERTDLSIDFWVITSISK